MGTALRRVRDVGPLVGRYIGRRGAYLLFLALLDITVGYSLLQPLPLGLTREVLYRPFVAIAPLAVWAAAWCVVGGLAVVAAAWPPGRPVTFALASLLKTAWAAGYLTGWLSHDPIYVRGYQTAAIFAAFGLVTLLVSGWRENGT